MKNRITARDYERISAYLDNQMSAKDRARLEARLKTDPVLRNEFHEINKTRTMLRSLPKRRAPHNYFINSSMVAMPVAMRRSTRLAPVMGMVSAISTIMLVLVLFGQSALLPERQVALAPEPTAQAEFFTLEQESQPAMELSPLPTQEAPLAAMSAPQEEIPTPTPEALRLEQAVDTTPTTIYLFAYPPTETAEMKISVFEDQTETAQITCEEYINSEAYPTSPYLYDCPTPTGTLSPGLQELLSTGSPTPTTTQTPTPTSTSTPTPTATATPTPTQTATEIPPVELNAAPASGEDITSTEGMQDTGLAQSEAVQAEAPASQAEDTLLRYILLAVEVSLGAVAILSGLTAIILRLRAGV